MAEEDNVPEDDKIFGGSHITAAKAHEAAGKLRWLELTWNMGSNAQSGTVTGDKESLEQAAEIFKELGFKGGGHGYGRITHMGDHYTMNLYADVRPFLLENHFVHRIPAASEGAAGARDTLGLTAYIQDAIRRDLPEARVPQETATGRLEAAEKDNPSGKDIPPR